MTLSEILANEEIRRREFPIAREKIFLAHAGVCPLPHRVAQAIADYAARGATGDQETFVYPACLDPRANSPRNCCIAGRTKLPSSGRRRWG